MSDLMGSHDNAAETAGIFDDGHAVHLFQSLVHHACATDVSEAFSEWKYTTEIRQLVGCFTQLHFLFCFLSNRKLTIFSKSPSPLQLLNEKSNVIFFRNWAICFSVFTFKHCKILFFFYIITVTAGRSGSL